MNMNFENIKWRILRHQNSINIFPGYEKDISLVVTRENDMWRVTAVIHISHVSSLFCRSKCFGLHTCDGFTCRYVHRTTDWYTWYMIISKQLCGSLCQCRPNLSTTRYWANLNRDSISKSSLSRNMGKRDLKGLFSEDIQASLAH